LNPRAFGRKISRGSQRKKDRK